ncbi:MAG: cation transporter [Anaerolineales bacterium]|nr:cation transporter [Anaerolineales bacterium]
MSGKTHRGPGGRRRRHDNRDMILMALSDSAQTLPEIKEHFYALPRRFGIFSPIYRMTAEDEQPFEQELAHDLDRLISEGQVLREKDRFALTTLGRDQANNRLKGIRRAVALASGLIRPEAVSRITVVVHLALAAIKLPAAILSGSAGLLNDSIDTLLDGFSSILVYFGVRFKKERAANVFLVILMLVTGGLTLFESTRRLFIPHQPDADLTAFLAVLVSALVCLFLGLYQRYAGLQNGSLTLITQSVDSRNHVLVAVGVTAGLIAALLRFPLLDAIVGVLVAALILRSGIEQAVGLIRSWESGEADLSGYSEKFFRKYREFRKTQLRDWMLYLVDSRRAVTGAGLLEEAARALAFEKFPVLREIGTGDRDQNEEQIAQAADDLFAKGWLTEENGSLRLSPAGRRRLWMQTLPVRRTMSRSLVYHPSQTNNNPKFEAGNGEK